MPTYLDRHDLPGATAEDVAQAHVADLNTQAEYDVRFITYWLDVGRGSVFCLAEAPNADAVATVHREAHGFVPNSVLEVDPRNVMSFLGAIVEPEPGSPWAPSGFRVIMFTDIAGSTQLIEQLGDVGAKNVVMSLDALVRTQLAEHGGNSVDHTGDGIMASFTSAGDAIRCAIAIQRAAAERIEEHQGTAIRVGLAAGEPITEDGRLFGAAVNLAARVCAAADPTSIRIPSGVRELALGKGFTFVDVGPIELKGFSGPVQIYDVPWADAGA